MDTIKHNPIRICFFANSARYILNFRINLMKALQSNGHQIIVLAPADTSAIQIKKLGFEFIEIPLRASSINPFKEIKTLYILRKALKKIAPDLIISATPKGNIYAALASYRTNIQQFANVSGLGSAYLRGGALGKILNLFYKITFPQISHIFFENSSDYSEFIKRKWVKISSASITPGLGVDLKKFSFCHLPKKTSLDKVYFLMIARLIADKGVYEYAAAAELIKKKYPSSEFHLLGERFPDNPTAIDSLTFDKWISKGDIIYHDHVEDIRPQIRRAHCVVLPSYREGMSRALLEAGAMGRALIATNVPGCREIIEDGVTGFLCEPRDVNSLSKAIENFLLLPKLQQAKMGRLSYEKILRQFNEEIVIGQYLHQVNYISLVHQLEM